MSLNPAELQALVNAIREQSDAANSIVDLVKGGNVTAQDVHFLAEVLNAVAARAGTDVRRSGEDARCSFCMKSSRDVRALVTSPNANICNECIEIARRTTEDTGSRVKRFLGLTP